jgi:8-oxo-dGTP pyrophosphatase MutT (NUDIX family)
MEIIYTGEELPKTITKSIMLCGPSARPGQEDEFAHWRNDAIQILNDKGYTGTIFSPENRNGKFGEGFDYDNQVDWEDLCLNIADCIVFWVPRDIGLDSKGNLKLPAFTTNVEFGAWCDSGKVVFGAPSTADKVKYLQRYAETYKTGNYESLTETLQAAMDKVGEGAERSDGERYVPLMIWNTPSFQSWYKAQTGADNVLEKAEVLYSFRPGYKDFVFLWILRVEMYITSEKRSKTNEFVLARTDTSSVLMWYPSPDSIEDYQVALIREFRSPASTEDGFIRELPGGSAHDPNGSPEETAIEEIHEETGMMIKNDKLKFVQARQVYGTLSSHKSYLYSYELNKEELDWLKSQDGIVHGVEEDTERAFVEIKSLKEILESCDVDWCNLGMIMSVLIKN